MRGMRHNSNEKHLRYHVVGQKDGKEFLTIITLINIQWRIWGLAWEGGGRGGGGSF